MLGPMQASTFPLHVFVSSMAVSRIQGGKDGLYLGAAVRGEARKHSVGRLPAGRAAL